MARRNGLAARNGFLFVLGIACAASVGCCGCLRQAGCGYAGAAFGGASCGCPTEASCSCPEASCSCPEASCSCPAPACGLAEASCGVPAVVGCGTPVVGQCRLLQRIRRALWGHRVGCGYPASCGCPTYAGEWQGELSPTPVADAAMGGSRAGTHGRRQSLARRQQQLNDNLLFTDEAPIGY